MMFCPKCKSLLISKDEKMVCSNCGFVSKEESKLSEKVKRKKIEVAESKDQAETYPRVKLEEPCKKCGNKEAFTWILQTRSADEPETIFFKCTKCKYTWRE